MVGDLWGKERLQISDFSFLIGQLVFTVTIVNKRINALIAVE